MEYLVSVKDILKNEIYAVMTNGSIKDIKEKLYDFLDLKNKTIFLYDEENKKEMENDMFVPMSSTLIIKTTRRFTVIEEGDEDFIELNPNIMMQITGDDTIKTRDATKHDEYMQLL
jgi:hypothetical protein